MSGTLRCSASTVTVSIETPGARCARTSPRRMGLTSAVGAEHRKAPMRPRWWTSRRAMDRTNSSRLRRWCEWWSTHQLKSSKSAVVSSLLRRASARPRDAVATLPSNPRHPARDRSEQQQTSKSPCRLHNRHWPHTVHQRRRTGRRDHAISAPADLLHAVGVVLRIPAAA